MRLTEITDDIELGELAEIAMEQAKLYMREQMPLAFVTSAKLSEEVAHRYRTAPHHLNASDRCSGDQIWILDLIVSYPAHVS
jgi:cytolysin-activating lysine-acyltransferase